MSHDLLPMLREQVRRIEHPTATTHGVVPLGVAAIDRALPGGGLARGALHEIFGTAGDEEDGALAAAFAAGMLARLAAPADTIVLWCLARPDLYGPGLAAHGLDPARLVLVRAPRDAEILWAMEEGLRSRGVAAVVGEVGTLPDVASRRLQLAAERFGVTALLLRRWFNGGQAARERNLPNAAATRWRIATLPSRPIPIPPFPSRSMGFPMPPLRHPRASEGRGVAGTAAVALGSRWRAVEDGLVSQVEPGVGHPHWRVELLRCRGGAAGCWEVEVRGGKVREGKVADAADIVSLAATMADRSQAPVGSNVFASDTGSERIRRTG